MKAPSVPSVTSPEGSSEPTKSAASMSPPPESTTRHESTTGEAGVFVLSRLSAKVGVVPSTRRAGVTVRCAPPTGETVVVAMPAVAVISLSSSSAMVMVVRAGRTSSGVVAALVRVSTRVSSPSIRLSSTGVKEMVSSLSLAAKDIVPVASAKSAGWAAVPSATSAQVMSPLAPSSAPPVPSPPLTVSVIVWAPPSSSTSVPVTVTVGASRMVNSCESSAVVRAAAAPEAPVSVTVKRSPASSPSSSASAVPSATSSEVSPAAISPEQATEAGAVPPKSDASVPVPAATAHEKGIATCVEVAVPPPASETVKVGACPSAARGEPISSTAVSVSAMAKERESLAGSTPAPVIDTSIPSAPSRAASDSTASIPAGAITGSAAFAGRGTVALLVSKA